MLFRSVIGGLFFANTLRDIQKREILLLPTLLILAGGVIRAFVPGTGDADVLWFAAAFLPGVILMICSLVTAGKIGFGDGIAVCAEGAWCGAESVLFTLFFALLLVPAAAGVLRFRGRPIRELPFMPFLLAGFLLERILFRGAGG